LILSPTVALAGCSSDRNERAESVARTYLRAAAEGDVARLCALRTDAALRRWGGEAGCKREAKGIAIDPPRAGVSKVVRGRLQKKAATVRPGAAKVLPSDTSTTDETARVVIDYGEAMLEDGHAVGGEILEMELELQGEEYRVAGLGFAAFAD
jgi:hypothetical protein